MYFPILSLFMLPPLRSIVHLWNVFYHFSFLILGQSVGLLGRGISPSYGRYLHEHRINVDRYPCLERDSNPRSRRSSRRTHLLRCNCDRLSIH
jgi:hypothetical protein